eukprot:gb/GECH01000776.1/.p1 GENE.gb/GECH01000776.1/~~gb/GECH01000776.1/.p1  ORF type:complete len:628 (+),score=199.98 gb/GECH01000776.1/:1-1884(+)
MSNRQVRKALGVQQEQENYDNDVDVQEEVAADLYHQPQKNKEQNLFDMLEGDEDGDEDVMEFDQDEELNDLENNSIEENLDDEVSLEKENDSKETTQETQSQHNHNNRKQVHKNKYSKRGKKGGKKGGKKKGKKKSNNKPNNQSDNTSNNDNDDDDIKFLEAEISKIKATEQIKLQSTEEQRNEWKILSVKLKNLDATTEIKRLFGSQVAKDSTQTFSEGTNPHPRVKDINSRYKKNALMKPRDHWPPYFNMGITMDLIEEKDGIYFYRYQWNQEYKNTELYYEQCVASHDPNNFIALLQEHPYHVSTLLQLAEVYSLQDDVQQSSDLVERALFTLENSMKSSFLQNAQQARTRLPYRGYPENHLLYRTMTRHIHALAKRGCPKTALEFCKFLLSLDPEEDPHHVLLFIDYYAIKARKESFLFELLDVLEEHGELANMPNLCFSKALALFQQEKLSEASDALEDAIVLWPMAVAAIADKIATSESSQQMWARILQGTFVTDEVCSSSLFSNLIHIYAERTAELWSNENISLWFQQVIQELLTDKKVAERIPDFRVVRQELVQYPEFSFYANATAPEIMGKMDMLDTRSGPVGSIDASHAGDGSQSDNPLMLFLSSLLPWNYDNINHT